MPTLTTPLPAVHDAIAAENALIQTACEHLGIALQKYQLVEDHLLSLPCDVLNAVMQIKGAARVQKQLECSLALGTAANMVAAASNLPPMVSIDPFPVKLAAHGKQLNPDGTISDIPQQPQSEGQPQ